jgi:hypothetical protein
MSHYLAIVRPTGTQNLIPNPSFEAGTYLGWAVPGGVGAGGSVTTEKARWGTTSFQLNSGEGEAFADTQYELDLVAGTIYTFSIYLWGVAGATYSVYFWDVETPGLIGSKYIFEGTDNWQRVWVTQAFMDADETWTEGDEHTARLQVEKLTGDEGGSFWIDGAQLEVGSSPTTYCDGEQDHCTWDGARHLSTSTRAFAKLYQSGVRDAGEVVLLGDGTNTLGAYFIEGWGLPPLENISNGQPLGLGSIHRGTRILPREITCLLHFQGDTHGDMARARQRMINLVRPGVVRGNDRFLLLWMDNEDPREATEVLYVKAVYLGGLEGKSLIAGGRVEKDIVVRFLAHYPLWRSFLPHYQSLASRQPLADVRYIARYNGLGWDNTGGGVIASPDVPGSIRAIVEEEDGTLLLGGCFIAAGGGSVDAVGIARLTPAMGTWSDVGITSATHDTTDPNALMEVNAIVIDPDTGDIYIGGKNIIIDGDNYHNIARFDVDTEIWEMLDQGLVAAIEGDPEEVLALQIIGTTLYVGGTFAGIAPDTGDPYTGIIESPALAIWDMEAHSWSSGSQADGPELITNTSFETDTDGYRRVSTTGTTIASIPDGSAPDGDDVCEIEAPRNSGISYDVTVEPSRRYEWEFYWNAPVGDILTWKIQQTRRYVDAFDNPSFEDADPTNDDAAWEGNFTIRTPSDGVAFDGTKVCYVASISATEARVYQDITLTADTDYAYQLAMRARGGANTRLGVVYFRAYAFYGGAFHKVQEIRVFLEYLFVGQPFSLWSNAITIPIWAQGHATTYRIEVAVEDAEVELDDFRVFEWDYLYEQSRHTPLATGTLIGDGTWHEQVATFNVPAKPFAPYIPTSLSDPAYQLSLTRASESSLSTNAFLTDYWRCHFLGGNLEAIEGEGPTVQVMAENEDGELVLGGPVRLQNVTGYNRLIRRTSSRFYPYGAGLTGYDSYDFSLLHWDSNKSRLLLSGTFEDGTETTHWLRWTGSMWVAMPDMIDGPGKAIAYDSNNNRYHVGGAFTNKGSNYIGNGYAWWDGETDWTAPTIDLPETTDDDSTAQANAILLTGNQAYVGTNSIGTAYVKASNVVSYNGTAPGYPVIRITRSGGTGATLREITNTTTGVSLGFDYSLTDGETLTVDTRRDAFTIHSNLYGSRLTALEASSAVDLTQFALIPGENEISAYIIDDNNTAISIEVYAEHWSPDGIYAED